MQLPTQLEAQFWQELQSYEETTHMRYVTSVERIGMKKGILPAPLPAPQVETEASAA